MLDSCFGWPNLNLAANAVQQRATLDGHAVRPSGRPKALDDSKTALAWRMHGSGESAGTIASALGVSRATVYRVLAEQAD
jgi:DNA invertase Pin-like site-specific DNA recombinase